LEKYNAYTVSGFLEDAGFIAYIKYTRGTVDWQQWLNSDPPNLAAFEEASAYLEAILSVERIRPDADVIESTLDGIRSGILREDQRRNTGWMIRLTTAIAACLLLTFAAGWYYYTSKITIATGYAQQRQVILPDHSIVTLNAQSSLTWYRAWKWRPHREVWLKGEGLFKVESGAADPFTAHTGDLSVQVLGTTFTIRQRRRVIAIALLEGKISVRDDHRGGAALILHPGEVVSYDDTTARVGRIAKLPNQPQAWVDHKIQANGMTVQDIIDNYEDTYGYKIVLGDPSQAAKRIDGTLSLDTEEGVLYMLANILNANIHREGSVIYLQPK